MRAEYCYILLVTFELSFFARHLCVYELINHVEFFHISQDGMEASLQSDLFCRQSRKAQGPESIDGLEVEVSMNQKQKIQWKNSNCFVYKILGLLNLRWELNVPCTLYKR